MSLNDRQRQGVESTAKKLLIIAGAGTGKTHTMVHRVVRLLDEGCPPSKILVVTFTRKAADEIGERIEQLCGGAVHAMTVSTLHAWCARLLRAHPREINRTANFTIYDETDTADVVEQIAREEGTRGKTEKLLTSESIRQLYEERKMAANALDYDDLEREAMRLLVESPTAQREWTHRYRHVLIDEFQDTSVAQVVLVHSLFPENLCVVGDPRQAIYGWRGAEIQTILDYASDPDWEVIELVENYRSVPPVVAVANGCVDGDWEPMRAARTQDHSGRVVHYVRKDDEAAWIAQKTKTLLQSAGRPGDVAVLARDWKTVRRVHSALTGAGVHAVFLGPRDDPWASTDGRQLSRAIRLFANPFDDELVALLANWGCGGSPRVPDLGLARAGALRARVRLLDVMPPELGLAPAGFIGTLDGSVRAAEVGLQAASVLGVFDRLDREGLTSKRASLEKCLDELRERDLTVHEFRDWWTDRAVQDRVRSAQEADSVQCMTIHAGKGLEWPVVFVAGVRDGVFPPKRGDAAEAKRLLYVAMTRARDVLCLTRNKTFRPPWVHKGTTWDASDSPTALASLRALHQGTA